MLRGEDQLSQWVKQRSSEFFIPPDDEVASALSTVSDWALASGKYTEDGARQFLGKADYWLISHALAHGYVVVTHEVPADSVNNIKIPNACEALGLEWSNPFAMLRKERVRFVLGNDSCLPDRHFRDTQVVQD